MQIYFSKFVHHVIELIRALKDLNRRNSCCSKPNFYRKYLIDELENFRISFLCHLDDFMLGRITGKIEERRKVTDVNQSVPHFTQRCFTTVENI